MPKSVVPVELMPEGSIGGLTLGLRQGELVCLGDPTSGPPIIVVQVVGIRGQVVRIRLVAPTDIDIHRESVWKRAAQGA